MNTQAQVQLTIKDVERSVGVSGLKEAEYFRLVYNALNGLRAALAMLITNVAVGAVVSVAGILISIFLAVPAMFIALGIPAAQAKQLVSTDQVKQGFSIGCVIGLFGWGKDMVHNFVDRTMGSGGSPKYMSGVAQEAYNIGLCLGYSSAIKLAASDKQQYQHMMTTRMIAAARRAGRKLYMNNWSDREWILHYSAEFKKMIA